MPQVITEKAATLFVITAARGCVTETLESALTGVTMGDMARSVNYRVPKTAESATKMMEDA